MIERLRKKYRKNGQFNVNIGQKITDAARKAKVPDDRGIYLIYEGFDCIGELIYIGHAGTMTTNGIMKIQGIRKRLGMRQDGMYRNDFFIRKMKKRKKGISVAWFVTWNYAGEKVLPAFAEAEAIQEYYQSNRALPELNREF